MKIQTIGDYTEIQFEEGLTFFEIMTAIQRFSLTVEDVCDRLLIQVQTEICRLTHFQLRTIVTSAQKLLEAHRSLEKAALVVNTGLQAGIVRLFMEEVRDTNCAFEVFRDRSKALTWFAAPSANPQGRLFEVPVS